MNSEAVIKCEDQRSTGKESKVVSWESTNGNVGQVFRYFGKP